MYTKDLIINHSSDGQVIEDFSEGSPDIKRTILSDALIIEPVNLCD